MWKRPLRKMETSLKQTSHNQITQKQTLTQEEKVNQEKWKRTIDSEKTTLTSLRNIECRIVKKETNKVNQLLPHTSTNNITELNELIYAGAKSVLDKIRIPSKRTKKKKSGWEIRLETQIKIYENRP